MRWSTGAEAVVASRHLWRVATSGSRSVVGSHGRGAGRSVRYGCHNHIEHRLVASHGIVNLLEQSLRREETSRNDRLLEIPHALKLGALVNRLKSPSDVGSERARN